MGIEEQKRLFISFEETFEIEMDSLFHLKRLLKLKWM